MTPTRALALGRQRYPSGFRTRRIHAAVPATSGPPQSAPGGRAYQTHRTHGRKISCIRLYLSLGAVRGRAASRCDPLRLIPRLGRICVSDTFVLFLYSCTLHNLLLHSSKTFLSMPAVRRPLANISYFPSRRVGWKLGQVAWRTAFFYVSSKIC